MSEHTPEPWFVVPNHDWAGADCGITNEPDQAWVAAVYGFARATPRNAERIVMCVNACAGMPDMQPGSVRKMFALLKAAKCPSCDGSGAIPHGPMPDGSWEAEQCQWCYERDEALREMGFIVQRRADGKPVVLRAHYEAMMGAVTGRQAAREAEPDFGALD